jgi:hypothetical protein
MKYIAVQAPSSQLPLLLRNNRIGSRRAEPQPGISNANLQHYILTLRYTMDNESMDVINRIWSSASSSLESLNVTRGEKCNIFWSHQNNTNMYNINNITAGYALMCKCSNNSKINNCKKLFLISSN